MEQMLRVVIFFVLLRYTLAPECWSSFTQHWYLMGPNLELRLICCGSTSAGSWTSIHIINTWNDTVLLTKDELERNISHHHGHRCENVTVPGTPQNVNHSLRARCVTEVRGSNLQCNNEVYNISDPTITSPAPTITSPAPSTDADIRSSSYHETLPTNFQNISTDCANTPTKTWIPKGIVSVAVVFFFNWSWLFWSDSWYAHHLHRNGPIRLRCGFPFLFSLIGAVLEDPLFYHFRYSCWCQKRSTQCSKGLRMKLYTRIHNI